MRRLNRIVIYPQDVALITGRSDRYGRLVLKKIKEELGKAEHQFITIQELADYMGIDVNIIEGVIF